MYIFSIFRSIDDEVNAFYQDRQTVFIRFAGCNLSCSYCDTQYAQDKASGGDMSVNEIMSEVRKHYIKKVTITGGEPLLQQDELFSLIKLLDQEEFMISMETNGSVFIPDLFYKYVHSFVVDYKLPSSGQEKSMMSLDEFVYLRKTDFIKFVILDRHDFDVARNLYYTIRQRTDLVNIAFSPVAGKLEPRILVDWIEKENLYNVILNLQLHKIIWPKITGKNER